MNITRSIRLNPSTDTTVIKAVRLRGVVNTARYLGCTTVHLSRFLHGKVGFSGELYDKLADYLSRPPDHESKLSLFSWARENRNPSHGDSK